MKFRPASHLYINIILVANLIIVVLSLVWSSRLLKTLSLNEPDVTLVFLIISVIFLVLLLAVAIFAIVRIVMARRAHVRGSRLRLKFVGAFVLIILVTSLPLIILAVNFTLTAVSQWLAPGVEKGLRGGENLALDYYDHVQSDLEDIIFSDYLIDLFVSENPDLQYVWAKLSDVAPYVDGMYVIGDGARGKLGRRDSFDYLENIEDYNFDGMLPRKVLRGETVFYGQRMINDFRIILSSRIPARFEVGVRDISLALSNWWYYDDLEENIGLAFLLLGVVLFGPLILLALFIALGLSERIISSLLMLSEATAKVSQGDFNFRVRYSSDNEFDFLTESFNRMIIELEENRLNALQSEIVTAWQSIARKMAHELRNPLTPIKLTVQRIRRRYLAQELNEKLMEKGVRTILREIERLDGFIREFRLVAGVAPLNKEICNLNDIVRKSVENAKQNYARLNWTFHENAQDVMVNVDPEQIDQLLLNLYNNSVEAEAREISITENLIVRGSVSYVRLHIRDDGVGMEKENRGKIIFHPYKSGSRNSSGFGLAVAQRIIDDHKGKIWFESELSLGTVFYIELPEVEKN